MAFKIVNGTSGTFLLANGSTSTIDFVSKCSGSGFQVQTSTASTAGFNLMLYPIKVGDYVIGCSISGGVLNTAVYPGDNSVSKVALSSSYSKYYPDYPVCISWQMQKGYSNMRGNAVYLKGGYVYFHGHQSFEATTNYPTGSTATGYIPFFGFYFLKPFIP
jgi:hypothetical protein